MIAMGAVAVRVAARPPGSRAAATKNSTKNAAMLSMPSTPARHHQMPCGSRGRKASTSRPKGRARTVALNSGRSAGR